MVKRPAALVALLAFSMMLAACDSTPPAVSTLMGQVADACQKRDKEALRACYATNGVTATQIDQQVQGWWDGYMDPGMKYEYTGIKYVSMADAPGNQEIMPDWITSAQGQTLSGIKFAPNLKVIGFILVGYKQPTGEVAGETVNVGIAADGTAKIVSIEPQK
jgi:hypothetical protein